MDRTIIKNIFLIVHWTPAIKEVTFLSYMTRWFHNDTDPFSASMILLGSVHKYFGGGAGQLKIFVVKLFDPPFASRQNFLNPPQQV